MKILVIALWATALIWLVAVLDRVIGRMTGVGAQVTARALLYALAFTPTVYHHAPNTIVAPLHLSTVGGALFYPYEYTAGMFLYGVAIPIACGWALLLIVLTFRRFARCGRQEA
ncbi:MAG TPA: hypothetical protein PKA41_10145 [Verrucomicrobiota bacterium]|nr:hypothetical protein [Verrucomicrobiota bacterium]